LATAQDAGMPSASSVDTATAFEHAAKKNLDRFLFCDGREIVEYEIVPGTAPPRYRPSGYCVVIPPTPVGRQRIALPLRPGGHVVTTWSDLVIGLHWNLQLLRRGYWQVHSLSRNDVGTRSTFGLLLENLAARMRQLATPLKSTFAVMARPSVPAYPVVANRVLMVIPCFARGGSERQMLVTAEALSRRGYEVCLLAFRDVEPDEPSYMDDVVKSGLVFRILSTELMQSSSPRRVVAQELQPYAADLPLWLLAFADGVARAIKDFHPAVVHCWLDQPAIIGGLSACILGVPRIIAGQLNTVATNFSPEELALYRSGYLALARNPSVVFANNSAAGAANYEDWLELARGRIQVLPNIFLPGTVRVPLPDELSVFRARHGLQAGAPVVGTLIRFVPQKDPDLWLEAAAIIAAARPDVRFLIAGYGPLEADMRRKIGELVLDDRVVLAGALNDVGPFYAAIDVLMLSSRYEGVPYVLIEAQAAGHPVVATDVGGNAEGFIDGVTGYLVKERSPLSLANAVLSMLEEDAVWMKRVAIEGPAYVHRSFGLETVIDQTLDLYELPRQAPSGAAR
jgi:glycosyltransferase involved in cell wall biosynthesis